jgi:hypothetical protein
LKTQTRINEEKNIIVNITLKEKSIAAWHQWLNPVILATQEAEIRRITVQSQP